MKTRNVLGRWVCLSAIVLAIFSPVRADEGTESAEPLVRRSGKHLRLVTDVDDEPFVDDLVASFDAAVPLWEKFWNLPTGTLQDWKVDAYVMKDASRFRREALLDYRVPEFPFGYSIGNDVWVNVQSSEYYTRHLLLHEGVHSLAYEQFGGAGPAWFMEGTAELLATHRGSAAGIEIGVVPGNRDDFAYWGRFKRMSQLRNESRIPSLETVMKYQANLKGDVEVYGWSWALASMLQAYPKYRDVLLEAARHGQDSPTEFNQWCYRRLGNEWPIVQARWRTLAQDFDYGFDWNREQIGISKQDPPWDGSELALDVAAGSGWQSLGVRLAPGVTIKLAATGDVILDDVPKPWISKPPGVTIKYANGKPLGQLIARMVPLRTGKDEFVPLLETIVIGEEATLEIEQPCWLLLRVNDDVGDLSNNQGDYRVTISRP